MVFRLIPSFEKRAQQIAAGQASLGKNVQNGSVSQKLKGGILVLSALTGWALESAMETSDSMRARGYGLSRRSRYAPFVFCSRDMILSGIMVLLFGVALTGAISGEGGVSFLPQFTVKAMFPLAAISYWAYCGLCFFPVILILWEDIQWRLLQSKI